DTTTGFKSLTTQEEYDIKTNMDCTTSGVIYLITCPCPQQYIGRTNTVFIRPVWKSVIEHLQG
ncbi:Hypothetical predicted protein, partial [Pelobates cultripes]